MHDMDISYHNLKNIKVPAAAVTTLFSPSKL